MSSNPRSRALLGPYAGEEAVSSAYNVHRSGGVRPLLTEILYSYRPALLTISDSNKRSPTLPQMRYSILYLTPWLGRGKPKAPLELVILSPLVYTAIQ